MDVAQDKIHRHTHKYYVYLWGDEMEIYVVKQGDTVTSIANRFDVPAAEIEVLNGIENRGLAVWLQRFRAFHRHRLCDQYLVGCVCLQKIFSFFLSLCQSPYDFNADLYRRTVCSFTCLPIHRFERL